MPKQCIAIESENHLSPRSTRKAALLALLMLVCVNAALVVAGFRAPRRYEDQFLAGKWALVGPASSGPASSGPAPSGLASLNQPSPRWDWLVVGDSSAALGVDPGRLGDRLGGPCLNAATFGSMGVVGDVWMVERFLENHPPPRGVIVVHAADVLSQPHSDAFYQYAASIPRPFHETVLAVVPEAPSGGQWLTLFRSRGYLPLLLVKDHLRQWIQWDSTAPGVIDQDNQIPLNGGSRFNANRADASKVKVDALAYFGEDKGSYVRFDSHHQAAFGRLIELAETNNLELFVAHGPIADIVRNHEDFHAKMSAANRALEQMLEDHPQVHYLLKDWVALPHDQMENPNHPTGSAVDVYTDALASAILDSNLSAKER